MPRPPRSVPPLFVCLYLLSCHSPGGSGTESPSGAIDPSGAIVDAARQIHWERSLDDAIALAKAEQRPLLLAVNMDGESASDRIVHEQYRDPAFVAASRNYVCVVASLFRHNPRDFDDQGNRIPCPRLGNITCGEHIANEPAMFQELLADGERVAPRHAVVLPDGQKAWDLSLSFDLTDIDRALIETGKHLPPPSPLRASGWTELAGQRSDRGRVLLEQAIARTSDETELGTALDALAAHGDAGSIDALRLIAVRLPQLSHALQQRFVATVATLQLGVPVATMLREQIETIDPQSVPHADRPSTVGTCGTAAWSEAHEKLQARRTWRKWLSILAQVDGKSPATQAYLLAVRATGAGDEAVSLTFGSQVGEALGTALASGSSPDEVLRAATLPSATGRAPEPDPFTVELPTESALEAELDQLDRQLRDHRDDVDLRARFAKASLDLARRRIESGGRDVALLLADAENYFDKALEQQPQRADWWIERARTAYYRSEFAAEVDFAGSALRAASGKTLRELDVEAILDDAATVEALRWLGDGCMNRYREQLATDPVGAAVSMAEALRAFGMVARSVFGDDNDWTSFASSCGALGLWRWQFSAAFAGALRVPSGSSIRQCMNQALWAGGRAEHVATVADAITAAITGQLGNDHPDRGAALWFAGYAWMLQAENHRRTERMGDATAAYATARERFATAAAQRPDYQDSCRHYAALCWLGEGLAEVRAGRRQAAADCLVAAVGQHAELAGATDGLGYDVLDLVDKIGEWRATGPSDVDPQQLFARIDALAPTTAFYAVAIADSQLREALRADGRNPQREMRQTVDAAGEPIRMLMGLPNDEGDGCLRASIALLRGVKSRLVSDEDKVALAQADTTWAERNLERNRSDGVAEALREAAQLLGVDVPAADADTAALGRTAALLRARLGEARPRWRMGR